MDAAQVRRYAEAIVAVGTGGKKSCYFASEVAECGSIIKDKNRDSAKAKVKKLFDRMKVRYDEQDVDKILNVIESLPK